MDTFATVVIAAGAVWIMAWGRRLATHVMVMAGSSAVLFHDGRAVRVLEPGRYWMFRRRDEIARVETGQIHLIPGQAVMTSDRVTVKLSIALWMTVVDPVAFVLARGVVPGPDAQLGSWGGRGAMRWSARAGGGGADPLHLEAQIRLRELVAQVSLEGLLDGRTNFGEQLLEAIKPHVDTMGVTLDRVEIRDLIAPKQARDAWDARFTVTQEAQVMLERSRAEQAALRSLANAAKMIRDNPDLYRLRVLHEMGGRTSPTTVVLNTGADAAASSVVAPADG